MQISRCPECGRMPETYKSVSAISSSIGVKHFCNSIKYSIMQAGYKDTDSAYAGWNSFVQKVSENEKN